MVQQWRVRSNLYKVKLSSITLSTGQCLNFSTSYSTTCIIYCSSDRSPSPLLHGFTFPGLYSFDVRSVHVIFIPLFAACIRLCPLLIFFDIQCTIMYVIAQVSLTSITRPSAYKLPPSPPRPDRLF